MNQTHLFNQNLSELGGDTISINHTGEIALWLGFLGNAFFTVGFIYTTKYAKQETIIFYNINTLICGIASVCYLLMTLGQSNYYTSDGELILWARYLEFITATPLLLIDLGLVAGATIPELFYICFCDILMIACGWWGSIATTTAAKWIFFACGSGFYIPIVSTILGTLRNEITSQRSAEVIRLYNILSAYTIIIWSAYPVLWVIHDGFKLIDINVECAIHTILDILAKGVFGAILVYSHSALEQKEISTDVSHSIELVVDLSNKANEQPPLEIKSVDSQPLPISPTLQTKPRRFRRMSISNLDL